MSNSNQDTIFRAIYEAIDEINAQQDKKSGTLAKAPETVLFGPGGRLDSLGLVSLIVEVEQSINVIFGCDVTLANEQALSQRNSPFRTVATLADHIACVLEENVDSES
ncbi:MAG TPA: hypothetical protein VGO43_05980 [Pyrinomonadaceae bacterium]|jgi:acyl carrier protein|nr:hypothetical protein [Pyrinomonadaceae bacterium]